MWLLQTDVPWLEDTSNAGVVETAARIMEILDRRKVPRNSGFWDQKLGAMERRPAYAGTS